MLDVTAKREQNSWNVPRLVIGAPQGRSGKTTITLGLLRALKQKGFTVQPFKKGSDYIDPSWHTAAAARTCRNLDAYFMDEEQIRWSLVQGSQGSRLSVIEGAMGLFDGLDLAGSSSTAEIAKITRTPVLLVIDATRMTRSVAAMVMGYQNFDPEVRITGVVLNKVAGARQEKLMREAIEHFCGLPVVGVLPKDGMLVIPDRHLGLVTNAEMAETERILERLAQSICENIDLNKVLKLANEAPCLETLPKQETAVANKPVEIANRPRIGIFRDRVFSFYYPENIEALEKKGAQIVFIDSLSDSRLPENIDALYIGGGFPEVFAKELEKNESLRRGVLEAAESYMPIYAECGGLMYLGRSIKVGYESYQMVGALPFDTVLENKPQGHGYTLMLPNVNNLWFASERAVRGHEFHNSRIVNLNHEAITFGFRVERGCGIDGQNDGIVYKRVFAAYNHVHVCACLSWADNFVNLARENASIVAGTMVQAAGA